MLSCRNHGYPIKHTLEECDLIKYYFKGDYKATGTGRHLDPSAMRERGMRIPTQKRAS
jgi:hypothetical protein